jgi:hypothetical protein
MLRALLEPLLLFLAPFVFYALYLAALRRSIGEARRRLPVLTVLGLLAAIAGFLLLGLARRDSGAYRPAHIENGRLVPGRFE